MEGDTPSHSLGREPGSLHIPAPAPFALASPEARPGTLSKENGIDPKAAPLPLGDGLGHLAQRAGQHGAQVRVGDDLLALVSISAQQPHHQGRAA